MEKQSIGSIIKILSETIGQQINRNFKEFNLTMQQMKVLHFLREREGKMETRQKDIQDYMRISHPTTVSILRLMEKKGFIKTSTSKTDKRMKIVTLTGQEEIVEKKIIRERELMEKRLMKGFTQKEKEDLRRYLQQMYQNITEPVDNG